MLQMHSEGLIPHYKEYCWKMLSTNTPRCNRKKWLPSIGTKMPRESTFMLFQMKKVRTWFPWQIFRWFITTPYWIVWTHIPILGISRRAVMRRQFSTSQHTIARYGIGREGNAITVIVRFFPTRRKHWWKWISAVRCQWKMQPISMKDARTTKWSISAIWEIPMTFMTWMFYGCWKKCHVSKTIGSITR